MKTMQCLKGFIVVLSIIHQLLQAESCYDANFVVIGGNVGYNNDSVQCHRWRD